MLLSRGNLMVTKAASQNSMDVGINCVHVGPGGETVAANGKIVMAVAPVDEKKVGHYPDVGPRKPPPTQGVSLPLDLVDKAIKNLPKDKRVSLQHAALTQGRDPNKVELTCTDMRQEQRVASYPKQEPFPNWKEILRKVKGENGPKVCVNRRDLIELLQALEDACPDRGGENPIFMEINPDGKGIILRCINRETGQRAIGGITAYNTGGNWMPKDSWEQEVFAAPVKRVIKLGGK